MIKKIYKSDSLHKKINLISEKKVIKGNIFIKNNLPKVKAGGVIKGKIKLDKN